MKKAIAAPVLAMCLFSCGAFAQEETGFYIGANYGITRIDASKPRDDLTSDLRAVGFSTVNVSIDESDSGFKLFAGYQINRHFAVEANYANLGKYPFTVTTTGPTIRGGGDLEVTGWGVDLVGFLPFTRTLSGFARVGAFMWESKANFTATGPGGTASGAGDDDGTELKLGIGLQWALTKNLSLRGEIEYYNFEEKLTMFSAGVLFRF